MATFYFDLDSLSETPVSPFLCGGCWEKGSRDPSLHPASSAGPHLSPLLPLRTPEAPTSALTRPPPSVPPSVPPPPRRGRGTRPKAAPAGLVASDTKTRLFPSSASHVCWCGFGVLRPCSPGVPPRPQERGSRIQQESGLGPEASHAPPSFCPPRSPPFTPPGWKGTGAVPAPFGWDPLKSTPHPIRPLWVPARPPKPKSLSNPGGPGLCPQLPALLPPGPYMGED